jgi:hypothetical protein
VSFEVDEVFDQIAQSSGAASKADLRKKCAAILADCVPKQLALIKDKHRFKCARCGRRAGKSHGAVKCMLHKACDTPNANILYVGVNRKAVMKNAWGLLQRQARKYEISIVPRETDLTIRFPNGSCITLAGCETSHDADNLRGSDEGYDLVVVDECQNFGDSLFDYLVNECLTPTLADRLGTLILLGTPDRSLAGLWYLSTAKAGWEIKTAEDGARFVINRPYETADDDKWDDVEIGWSSHWWTAEDNTAAPHIWKDHLATKRRNAWSDNDPVWLREYLAQWIASDKGFVYRYLEERNGWEPDPDSKAPFGLPEGHIWEFGLGIDFGFVANFAVVVGAWSETSSEYYFIDGMAMPGLIVPEYAAALLAFVEKYQDFGGISVMVADSGAQGRVIVETLNQEFGLDIEAADKTGAKEEVIDVMNSDLLTGRCKVLKDSTLAQEMAKLQWRPKGRAKGKVEEDTSETVRNDSADAGLYLWRHLHQFALKDRLTKPLPGSPDAYNAMVEARVAELIAERHRKGRMDLSDRVREMRGLIDEASASFADWNDDFSDFN